MAQYSVPQFVDRETRLIGPLTVRQILTLGAAAGLLFIIFFILDFFAFTIAVVVVSAVALALAFVQINGKPLLYLLTSFLNFFLQPRTYLWKRRSNESEKEGLLQQAQQQTITGDTQEGLPQQSDAMPEIGKQPSTEQIKGLADLLDK